ncbi:MAG: DUF2812 domain-containing protein [Clostridium sp.]|nr:DUF2812 domain-containing protein [Clostridium sp.]
MGINNKKVVVLDFFAYEISSLIYYLEEMAKKGWLLESISSMYAKFKKIEPKNIKYTIDIIGKISAYEELDEESLKEYRDKKESEGWKFLYDYNNMQIFYSEYNNEEFLVTSKNQWKVKEIFKNSLFELFVRMVPMLFLAFNQYISIFRRRGIDIFTDNGRILGLLLVIGFLVIHLVDLLRIFKFKVSPYKISTSSLWIKFKSIFISSIFLMLFIYLISSIIKLNSIDNRSGITVILGLVVIGAIIAFVYYLVNINNKNIKKNTTIASLLIVIVSIALIISNFIVDNDSNNTNKSMNRKEHSLSLNDFNDELISDKDLFIDESSSFLASKIFYNAYGKNMQLSYELFESDYEWITKLNFNRVMKWFENQGIKYTEIETNLPEDIKVLVNEKGSNYFLVSSKKMIELIGVEDIKDKEDFFNTVYEKIFTL